MSTESGAAAEKRARHRVLVKRAYHQKIHTLETLRQHERELKAQYSRLLRAATADADARLARGENVSRADATRDLYVRLTTIREQLQREQRVLQRFTHHHEQFQTQLGTFARDDIVECTSRQQQRHTRAYVLRQPLTEAQSMTVCRAAAARAMEFRASAQTLSLGSEVFGWTHRYRFPTPDGCVFDYSIAKTFPRQSAEALSARNWAIMTSPAAYRALHSCSMTATLHVVQHVNSANVVLCRVLQRAHASPRFKTLFLASQVRVEHGYLTIYRALDHRDAMLEQHVPDGDDDGHIGTSVQAPAVVWLDMFAWTLFHDTGDGGARFEFGGSMAHTSRENAQFWMLEVLLMALRWEAKAVGPLFALTTKTDTASSALE